MKTQTLKLDVNVEFPSRSYRKYKSQGKDKMLLHKFKNDTGYPQDVLSTTKYHTINSPK